MAWIQIHQQLKDHRKVLAAADELDIEPAHMLGLLFSFWLWAIDNAPDGSLSGISDFSGVLLHSFDRVITKCGRTFKQNLFIRRSACCLFHPE